MLPPSLPSHATNVARLPSTHPANECACALLCSDTALCRAGADSAGRLLHETNNFSRAAAAALHAEKQQQQRRRMEAPHFKRLQASRAAGCLGDLRRPPPAKRRRCMAREAGSVVGRRLFLVEGLLCASAQLQSPLQLARARRRRSWPVALTARRRKDGRLLLHWRDRSDRLARANQVGCGRGGRAAHFANDGDAKGVCLSTKWRSAAHASTKHTSRRANGARAAPSHALRR